MNVSKIKNINISDLKPEAEDFLGEVLRGLNKPQKELPTKYLYDERGSTLYERICTLDEYYIPKLEVQIMKDHILEIVRLLDIDVNLIEYGCGSCTKTRILLDHLPELAAYIPIDISKEQLISVAEELKRIYPQVQILPVCADFTDDFLLPSPDHPGGKNVVYFPGSSIGNFGPKSTRALLRRIANICQLGGGLLIGIDLDKEPEVLYKAYNDGEGITAAFNLNLLERINRELDGDFDLSQFEHNALYNTDKRRVEMHLTSLRNQTVNLNNTRIHFGEGESIWTESSYKYDLNDFTQMASDVGFTVERTWTDEKEWFSILYLVYSN
jgi:dimethylhistidine N-methyltransferase